jgi:hypothetical protein
MPDINIQPAPGAMANNPPTPAPVAPDAPAAAPDQGQQAQPPQLPPEVLKIHAIQGILAGAPAAASMDISQFAKTEDGKTLAKAGDLLQQAGLGFYHSMSGDTGVVFNQLFLHPAELQAADKAGKLTQIAPPWTKVDHALSKAGAAHPALTHRGAPLSTPMAPPPTPPQAATGAVQPAGKPIPAAAQNKLLQARIAATMPAAPTGGAAPGGSQLLNRVLKPVV